MNFIFDTANFIKKNKGKIATVAAATSAGYYLYQYINETSNQFEHGSSGSFVEKKNNVIEDYFEEITQKCNKTVVNICKKIEQILNEEFSLEEILIELNRGVDGTVKLNLFNQLKLTLMNRVLSEIYCFSLFTSFMKVQISIVTGYLYLDYKNKTNFMEKSTQYEFFELSSYFCSKGLYQLIDVVTKSVKEIFGEINLDEKVDFTKVLFLFAKCQDSINTEIFGNETFIKDYFFEENPITVENSFFNKISEDLFEYLNTDDFKKCLEDSFNQSFIIVKDKVLSRCLNKEKIKLASVLPRIKKALFENSSLNSEENSTIHYLLQVPSIKSYSENVYESIISS